MKFIVIQGHDLTPAMFNQPGTVLQRISPTEYTIRRKPLYPKGFTSMAETLWLQESLEERKKWKRLLAGPDSHFIPFWDETIEIYRAVLYLRLVNNEPLNARAPRRLPALPGIITSGIFCGYPSCNYATLPAATKLALRNRIAARRAELHQETQLQTQRPTQHAQIQRSRNAWFAWKSIKSISSIKSMWSMVPRSRAAPYHRHALSSTFLTG